MYPSEYFSLFPPFPRTNSVFVAMSFDELFEDRWLNVIKPGIESVQVLDDKLIAHRVDTRIISDSILTEILNGVSESKLVIADVSTIGYLNDRVVRNSNVLYEVGLAQAIRMPEEVLLFRSDKDELLFDMANVRVNHYSPDEDQRAARNIISDSIISSLNEIDLRRSITVKKLSESLDYSSWWVLAQCCNVGKFSHPKSDTMRTALVSTTQIMSINKLIEIGAIQAQYIQLTQEMIKNIEEEQEGNLIDYMPTNLGRAIFNQGVAQMGFGDPKLFEALDTKFGDLQENTDD